MRKSLTAIAHELIRDRLQAGDMAVDATVGNGHDCCFLARQVAPGGRVLGLDIQESAIRVARTRLEGAGLMDSVDLLQCGHEALDQVLPAGMRQGLAVVMFNLGYLPGGRHDIVTRPETTLKALQASLAHLREDGLISLMIYRGHPGGGDEYQAILDWLRREDIGHRFPVPGADKPHAPRLLHLFRQ
ncbi:class I SAM-dependent methyltransferase [Natronospira bacteriovora]|uniref:Class I SAM-dependent methyltransferase n=1 Tax=Natronospira bacteriovora TaxID=3069753 RepID=A0ABU0W7G4_9GAMM|nr:class I SAM-dependent methyltransferase [Natronospira sp. AB-CW4]MDQ2069971.1 class I SAM-dependent methyltransferase [Natronospira sp. AB-CW4]